MKIACCLSLIFVAANAVAQRSPEPSKEENTRMLEIRKAGLADDRSQVNAILATLTATNSHPRLRTAAIRALSRLRSAEALSALTNVVSSNSDPEQRDFALVCRARIVAELAAENILDPSQKALAELQRFLQESGLTIESLNAANVRQGEAMQRTTHAPIVRELLGLRELADMIYRRRFLPLANAAVAAGIRFESDPPASLKLRLAPLTTPQRVAALIDTLANLTVLNFEDQSTLQLAIDEGFTASRAAVAKLQLMGADLNRNPEMGYAALFRMIRGVGDKDAAPVIETFLQSPNRWVRYYADQVLPYVKAGIPQQYQIRF